MHLVVVFGSVVTAWVCWRAIRSGPGPAELAKPPFALALFGNRPGGPQDPGGLHLWQPQGRFDFEVVGCERYQPELRAALATQGAQCQATVHAQPEVGRPVEVRVGGLRVGFLADGDATRFQRRLAYEGRPGQTSQCGARIVERRHGERAEYAILLDLKPFRH